MTSYNIYYGTIGKTLGVKYRFTKNCKAEQEALNIAKKACEAFFYKNEGKYGLPSFIQINKESQITELPITTLYEDHIKDMCRWYIIPTELDTIPNKKIRY